MTDPDHRCSQARGNRQSVPSASSSPPPQPNFGFVRVADIPQVHISEIHRLSIDRSSRSAVPAGHSVAGPPVSVSGHPVAGPSVLDDPFRIFSTVTSGVDYQFLSANQIPQVQLPPGWNAPLCNPVPLRPHPSGFVPVNQILQVQLSDNWNALLQNPIPVVPPVSVPLIRSRGRGRGRLPTGPLHDLSGAQTNPAWNNLHRGHIAHRELTANQQAILQYLELEHLRNEEQARQAQLQAETERLEQLRREQEELRKQNEKIRELLKPIKLMHY